jgi:hypothetical protein
VNTYDRRSRPACAICGVPCIPLADYDAPTCVRCDDAMVLALERAALAGAVLTREVVVERVVEVPVFVNRIARAPRIDAAKCGTRTGYQRHKRDGEDVCERCTVAERTYQRERKRRVRAQQREDAAA